MKYDLLDIFTFSILHINNNRVLKFNSTYKHEQKHKQKITFRCPYLHGIRSTKCRTCFRIAIFSLHLLVYMMIMVVLLLVLRFGYCISRIVYVSIRCCRGINHPLMADFRFSKMKSVEYKQLIRFCSIICSIIEILLIDCIHCNVKNVPIIKGYISTVPLSINQNILDILLVLAYMRMQL